MVLYHSNDYFDLIYVGNLVLALLYIQRKTFLYRIQAHWLFSSGEANLLKTFPIYGQTRHLV